MNENEDRGKSPKEFEGFVSTALRGPKMGIYQNLLAGLLIRASTTLDPLKKIQNLTEAAELCKKKDNIDMEFVEVASTVCRSLMNTEVPSKPKGFVHLTWAFPQTEANWKKYIAPWHVVNLTFIPLRTAYSLKYPLVHRKYGPLFPSDAKELRDYLDGKHNEITEAINKMCECEAFFQETSALTKASFFTLKGEFSRWALTKLLPIQAQIADLVDPRIFNQVAGLIMGRKEEELEIEGSMDKGKGHDTV